MPSDKILPPLGEHPSIDPPPFGRQREPVEITLSGDSRDVNHYVYIIKRAIGSRGLDEVQVLSSVKLKIYPTANND